MTVAEFLGCTMVAFGPALAMFYFTITDDPIKIILLIFSSFVWLLALLISSFIWFIFIPLRETLVFGVIVSILIQVFVLFPFQNDLLAIIALIFHFRKDSDTGSISYWKKRVWVLKS